MKKYWKIESSALLTIGVLAACNIKEETTNQQAYTKKDAVFE